MPYITRSTVSEIFLERVKATPGDVAFRYKNDPLAKDPWKSVTFRQFYQDVRLISFGLWALEAREGHKVALLSNTRYEWSLCDMAILGIQGVTVPIYASTIPEDVIYILNHCEASVAIVEDAKQLQKLLDRRKKDPECLPLLKKIVVIEPSAMVFAKMYDRANSDILTLDALRELGKREEAKRPERFEKLLREAKPSDVATICYTSGTTGIPKGAMITHDNIVSVLDDCLKALHQYIRGRHVRTLSFLPYSHILGKIESMCIYTFGWECSFAESIEKLPDNLRDVKPNLIFAVPRIFEKAYAKVQLIVNALPPRKKKVFLASLVAGKKYFAALEEDRSPNPIARIQYLAAKQLIFSKVRENFGGKLEFAICGGAPLPREIGEFFQIIGIDVLEGYGLTETTGPIAVNTPDEQRFGTVGRPLADVSVRIAPDGEILLRSRKVFSGYYKMPQETADAFEDGWFKTGDIGLVDPKGFLKITDRKKDIIVTSGGKNVAPQKIENLAKTYELISQFVVYGDRRNYLTALVTLNADQVIRYANEHQILFSEYAELVKNAKILALVQKIIEELNQGLSSFEQIKKFVILAKDFTIESGELTPSLKVRRKVINERFSAELDSLYQG